MKEQMVTKKRGLHISGRVRYQVFDAKGKLKLTKLVDNIIVETMIDNVLNSFVDTASNPCSGFNYIGLGSGSTPETVNDTSLDSEFATSAFGTTVGATAENYAQRISDFVSVDYTANTYTVSGEIVNASGATVSVNESGIFNGATPGATGDEMACRATSSGTISIDDGETLTALWVWTVASA